MKNLLAFSLLLATAFGHANTAEMKPHTDPVPSVEERLQNVGTVLFSKNELVALGEREYVLIQRNEAMDVAHYAPISVVPKVPGTDTPIGPQELQGPTFPTVKTCESHIRSGGKVIGSFKFQVRFAHSATSSGPGKYIQMIEVVPVSVSTSAGWDVNASLKLVGIMTHDTEDGPVAGALISVKYKVNSWSTSFEKNDSFHVTGNGDFRAF